MWRIVYNALLNLALPFFVVYSLVNKKIRKNFFERLFANLQAEDLEDAIWIHAASIGESMIAENIIRYMKKHNVANRFLITTNTYYTKELMAKKLEGNVPVYSLPFDLSYTVKHFISQSTFSALLIVETEIWPNLIWEAQKRKIPVIILNGRISDHTVKNYTRFSFFFRHVLSGIDCVLAQSSEQMQRYISIGMDPQRVINTGNLKYYRDIEDEGDAEKDNIVTFGSIREKEVEIIIETIEKLKKDFADILFFIAPRELLLIDTIEKTVYSHMRVARYSKFRDSPDRDSDVVVVDTVGDLLRIYRTSKVAFVGGSLFPYGGQNLLEPLFFGTPVLFGPHTENFQDISRTITKQRAGMVVMNGEELYSKIKLLLQDDSLREEMGNHGRKIIDEQREVMKKTIDFVMDVMHKKQRR